MSKFDAFDYRLAKENAYLDDVIQEYPFIYDPSIMISTNEKTVFSWNLPLMTCKYSTPLCQKSCYGLRHFLAMNTIIRASVARLFWLNVLPLDQLVDSMVLTIPWGVTSFRINGIGDLTAKSVELFNAISKERDDIQFYCYSRDPFLTSMLNPRITRNLSIDNYSLENIKYTWGQDINIAYLKEYKGEDVPEYVDIIHPVNSREELCDVDDDRTCGFAIDKNIKCPQCKRCIVSTKRRKDTTGNKEGQRVAL